MEIGDRYTEWIAGLKSCVYTKKMRTQVSLAEAVNIAKEHLNAILKERGKKAGDGLQDEISKALGMTHDQVRSLGRWVLDGNDPASWKPPAKGQLAPPLKYLDPQGITKNITGKRPLSEILSSLPASQKYQEAKDVLVAGIGIPELEADKLLMKHMGLPPELAASLPEEKLERFAHIWEYACVKNQGLKKTAYPEDKEQLLEQYLKGELDDVALYLRAIDWLNELFGDGGEPK